MNPKSHPVSVNLGEDFNSFGISPFTHDLSSHPLMQMDRLRQLAEFLEERKLCRFVSPDIQQNSKFHHQDTAVDGRSLADVFDRIEEPKSWVAFYNIQTNPEYKTLLDEIIAPVRPRVEMKQGRIFKVGGFIFISAPPSVTPFHIDRENNFWFQVRGRKIMTVFDHLDREVVSDTSVEEFIVNRSLDDVSLKAELAGRGFEFEVGPGDGVYFPSTSPHMTRTTSEWVKSNDGVSISIGVVFYTEHTKRQAQVYQCNTVLRRLGLSPACPGRSVLSDSVKAGLGHYLAAFKKRFRGYEPPAGSY